MAAWRFSILIENIYIYSIVVEDCRVMTAIVVKGNLYIYREGNGLG